MSSNREEYDEDLTNQEIDELCNKVASFDKVLKAYEDQKAEIKRLREYIRKVGHRNKCSVWLVPKPGESNEGVCDCGYAEASAESEVGDGGEIPMPESRS